MSIKWFIGKTNALFHLAAVFQITNVESYSFHLLNSDTSSFICWYGRVWMWLWVNIQMHISYMWRICVSCRCFLFTLISQCLFNKIFSHNISRLSETSMTAFPTELHHATIWTLTTFAMKINAIWNKTVCMSFRHIMTCKVYGEKKVFFLQCN